MSVSIGPLIIDLAGTHLTSEENELLGHPSVGGVIFFARNFESPAQMAELTQAVRASRSTPLLLTVDQEGGRVQRFKEGFHRVPAMGKLGELYETHKQEALQLARLSGLVIATELQSVGVNLTFAPVLDVNDGDNPAIGTRAFHQHPQIIAELAVYFMQGMKDVGMAATGKHFPGHGSVKLDSHLILPVDDRGYDAMLQKDLVPFMHLIQRGLPALMAAHIVFPQVDAKPVGFSAHWLRTILRKQLQFDGMIFSDDLSMEGASIMGDFPSRTYAALEAGCDMALLCNQREGVIKTLDNVDTRSFVVAPHRFATMMGRFDSVKRDLTPLFKQFNDLIVGATGGRPS